MTETSLHLLKVSTILQPRGIFGGLQGRLSKASKEKKAFVCVAKLGMYSAMPPLL